MLNKTDREARRDLRRYEPAKSSHSSRSFVEASLLVKDQVVVDSPKEAGFDRLDDVDHSSLFDQDVP